MTDTPRDSEIADYRLAVERHLSDLPAPIREDLLNGLEEHLAEVSADLEPGVPLSHLLGSPETYARELRETVEVPKRGLAERFRKGVIEPAADRAKAVSDRFVKGTGFGKFSDLREALRPGWWVLRGLIAGLLVCVLFGASEIGVRFPVFRTDLFLLAFVVGVMLLFVWLSLRLGVRSQSWSRRYQLLVAVGGLYLLYAGGWSFATSLIDDALFPDSMTMTQSTTTDREHVQDVYVYTEDGELLTGVYLFDQNGNPLYIGEPWECEDGRMENPFENEEYETPNPFESTAEAPLDDDIYGYRYPLCLPEDEPTGLPGSEDEASPSPGGESPTTPVETPIGESPTTPVETPTGALTTTPGPTQD